MSLTGGQATIGTVSTTLFPMPPGPAVVTVNSGTVSTATAYLGFGAGGASTAAGYILDPGRSVTFAAYARSAGANVTAVTTGASAATLSWLISTSG